MKRRPNPRKFRNWLVLALAAWPVTVTPAEIYKVIDEHGNVTYQDQLPDKDTPNVEVRRPGIDSGTEIPTPDAGETAPPGPSEPVLPTVEATGESERSAQAPEADVAAAAWDRRPLLLPGKRSLYQRVLVRPSAVVRVAPEAGAPVIAKAVAPFTAFYVYGRRSVEGVDWLELGLNSFGEVAGWSRADSVIDWRQTLTVAFKEPLGRARTLLFREREYLKRLVDKHDLVAYHALARQVEAEALPADSPVVAVQPNGYVDILQDFYLVPILEHEQAFLGPEPALLLKVASVPLAEAGAPARDVAPAGAAGGGDYRSGIVFVIDSTISMQPYIDRTYTAVRRIYDALGDAALLDKVNFGLVAYRDSIEAVPALEYLSRTVAPLQEGGDPRRFLERFGSVSTARVSSRDFVEDAYAGVKRAIEESDWTGFDARYVVLVTDAGPRESVDALSATGLDAESLRQLAFDKGISVWVLHLLTPQGRADHASAAERYRRLSLYPGIGDFYYGVPLGSVEEFGRVVEAAAGQITDQVRETARALPPALPAANTAGAGDRLVEFQQKVEKLGYALRMRYLARREGSAVPDVFNAWLVDREFNDPERRAVDVRVLLSRDQLSDLRYVLKRVLDAAEEGILSPRTFLEDLKSLAATLSRDPAAAGASTRAAGSARNLVDLGYMREYIDDLPYTGEIMGLSIEEWEQWPARRQLDFLHRLESKINYYEAIHDNLDLWVSLDGGPIGGDSVFPIALERLP